MSARRPLAFPRFAPPDERPGAEDRTCADLTVYGADPVETELFRRLAPSAGVRVAFVDGPLTADSAARSARCASVSHRTRVTNEALRALRAAGGTDLSTRSIGANHVDLAYAERLGLRVGTVAYSPDSVADFTLMLILMSLRHAKPMVLRSEGHDYRLAAAPGRELRDLTVGVVGTGRIGAAVVDRLQGFGGRVLTHDARTGGTPLDTLLRQSDVVTLHTPLDETTHHLLDRRRIARLKPGAIVVNTGRGGLVDTEALVDALEGGRLGGAALDVLEGEEGVIYTDCSDRPVVPLTLRRLQRLPHVIISPHTAFHTDHALSDIVENTLLRCRDLA